MITSKAVSIIISSYNYERFLSEAIDSALNQTYPDTEVIVVDDGSTDNSREIIAGYGDRIISVLKENGGQASAFNAGFLVSRGEVIFFLDSDDMLLPYTVENAVNFFNDPRVAKVHWPLRIIDKHGRNTGVIVKSDLPEGDLQREVVRNGPFGYTWPPTSGNAWARRFIDRIFPMPEGEYKTCPDLYLCALAPLFGPVRRLSKPQGFWRRHGENNIGRDSFEERLRVGLWREEHCLGVLAEYCREMGIDIDSKIWKANSWWHQINQAIQVVSEIIPPDDTFILVNQDLWGNSKVIAGRRCISFPEKDGQYWGPPPDDDTAIQELERLRRSGAKFMVFVWPFLWWLDCYPGLHQYLRSECRCVLENDRLVVFDLY